MKNLYKILDLSHDASPQQIQNALRKCAEKQTLDIDKIKKIRQILLDDATRQRYDQQLRAHDPDFFESDEPTPKERKQMKNKGNPINLINQILNHSPVYYALAGLMILVSILCLLVIAESITQSNWITVIICLVVGISTTYAFWVLKKYADRVADENNENISKIKKLVYFSMFSLPLIFSAILTAELEKSKSNTNTYQQEEFEEESDWETWDNYKLPQPINFSYESTTQYEILYLKPISDNVYDVVSTQTFKSSGSIYYDKSRINCNKRTYQYIANEEQLVPVLKRKIKQDAQENYATEGSAYHKIRAICR